jgi:acyl carrier protein
MTELRERVRRAIADSGVLSDPASIRFDVPLRQQGVDSLDAANLVLAVEDACGARVPDDQFEHLKTIDDLIAYLSRVQGGGAS